MFKGEQEEGKHVPPEQLLQEDVYIVQTCYSKDHTFTFKFESTSNSFMELYVRVFEIS